MARFGILAALAGVFVAVTVLGQADAAVNPVANFTIVESIPMGVDFHTDMTYADAFYDIVSSAKEELVIACMYMTLSNNNTAAGGGVGQRIYEAIIAAHQRGVDVRIAKSVSGIFGYDDVERLVAAGVAKAAYVNYTALIGAGILHTKFMIADNRTYAVGSANMDWRSLTQIKELGIYFSDSPATALELRKVFGQYWVLGTTKEVPKEWPASLETQYTRQSPMKIVLNGTESDFFFSLSPPPAQPASWTDDSAAITDAMFKAEEFIYVEVMDYMPAQIYVQPHTYWNTIDNAIRKANYNNGTHVRILIGHWEHSIPVQENYMQSLNALPNVTVKWFIVPPYKVNVPFTRVNHAKWMVTDKQLFIDTSNWTGDYFTNTAGVGTNTNNAAAQAKGVEIFLRDWNSKYTVDIPPSP